MAGRGWGAFGKPAAGGKQVRQGPFFVGRRGEQRCIESIHTKAGPA
jgi:hypothetical protein